MRRSSLMWLWSVRVVSLWRPTRLSWLAPAPKQPSMHIGLSLRISSFIRNISPLPNLWLLRILFSFVTIFGFDRVLYVIRVLCVKKSSSNDQKTQNKLENSEEDFCAFLPSAKIRRNSPFFVVNLKPESVVKECIKDCWILTLSARNQMPRSDQDLKLHSLIYIQ